ncbi:MFS transporter [Candidatus Stoquefichus sp. SB1]|uniref:MFS transporter n=1 Tax=Candidatus Stoquefichus sp. SB1 TaxID=1658109 RepID=UPI00067F6260|nr:MFS transporter [Candidatus Stoquefichus sp. SB1]
MSQKRWGYLICAVIILLFMGIGYAFSLFVVPIENDLGLTRSQTSLAFTLCFICFSIGSFTGGFLVRKIAPQLIMRIIAFVIGTGFLTTTFASQAWHLYISYSIFCGISIGMIYNVCVSVIPLYFQDKLGLTTGVLLMGYAMSTTAFGQLCEYGVKMISWKGVFAVLGISSFLILLLGSFILHYPTPDEKMQLPQVELTIEKISYQPQQVLKTKTFYIFVLFYILIGGIGMSLINHMAPTFQEDLQVTATTTATLVSLVSLFNGLGRVFWGLIFDKKGTSFILKVLGILVSLSLLLMVSALWIHHVVLFAAGAACVLFCYGGSSSLAPIVMRYLYGNEYFSINFSITNIGTLILSTFPTFIGTIQIMTHHYFIAYILLMLCGVVTILLSFLYHPIASKELSRY